MIIKKGWFFLNNSIKVDLSMNVLFSGIGCQERGFENMVLSKGSDFCNMKTLQQF